MKQKPQSSPRDHTYA